MSYPTRVAPKTAGAKGGRPRSGEGWRAFATQQVEAARQEKRRAEADAATWIEQVKARKAAR